MVFRTLIGETPPPWGGFVGWFPNQANKQTKNQEEEDPPWRTTPKLDQIWGLFFRGGSLPLGSWFGNHPTNKKTRLLRSTCRALVTLHCIVFVFAFFVWVFCCDAATQLTLQWHQEHTQVVYGSMEARKRPTEPNSTLAIDWFSDPIFHTNLDVGDVDTLSWDLWFDLWPHLGLT